MATVLLFVASGLPIEAKAFGLILLLSERRQHLTNARELAGHFFLHLNGECRYQGHQYRVKRIHFFSRYLILLDIEKDQTNYRFPIAFDAVIPADFCHLSRICLGLKT